MKKSTGKPAPKAVNKTVPKGKKVSEMKSGKQMSAKQKTASYKSQAHFEATKNLPPIKN